MPRPNPTTKHLSLEEQAVVADAMMNALHHGGDPGIQAHIATCQECRSAVLEIIEIAVEDEESSAPALPIELELKPSEPQKSRWQTTLLPLGMAASTLLFIGLFAWALSQVKGLEAEIATLKTSEVDRSKPVINPSIEEHLEDTQTAEVQEKEATLESVIRESEGIDKEQEALLEGLYAMNESFEEQLDFTVRGTSVTVESPVQMAYELNQQVAFSWSPSEPGSDALLLYNNKGTLLLTFQNLSGSHLLPAKTLNAGLYYWKLLRENEVVHLGKFTLGERIN